MIRVHRLNGQETVVNAELIEWVEAHGTETVLSLATGNKIVVTEGMIEVIEKTLEYKKKVYAAAVYLPEFLRGEKREGLNMSLTFIAVTGVLVGFLCLVIGFFMEDANGLKDVGEIKERRVVKTAKKKMVVPRKKAA